MLQTNKKNEKQETQIPEFISVKHKRQEKKIICFTYIQYLLLFRSSLMFTLFLRVKIKLYFLFINKINKNI